MKWLHAHRAEVPGMIANFMKGVWGGMKKAPRAFWNGLKKIPKFLTNTIMFIGRCLMFCSEIAWKLIKRLPNATNIALRWVWTGIKKTGLAIAKVFKQLISLSHTILTAIGGFFQRITPRDVALALVRCLHAIFVDVPKTIWKWLYSFGEASLKVFKAMFSWMGWLLWELIKCIMEAVVYVPKKIGEILVACGSTVKNGGREVLVWIDPKRV
ncbi:hypothetical protein EK21DRAFT_112720 [Setomelanomma holmii]|uniref:Uncharacterized protein n=1 Tax=Setomelanomma holmii TaxID=210430 RepID=A0A9P4H7R6_9PLEO|nr:hypothetical protein EK21DRAFT_112720 [Setomelanomma holmii]